MTYRASSLVAVFLDTNVPGLVTQRKGRNPNADAAIAWQDKLQDDHGILAFVPEIADYESRREFLRSGNADAISRLDAYANLVPGRYLPLNTPAVREAAVLRAQTRNAGTPTANRDALDGDALIAAQVFDWCATNRVALTSVAVATGNVSDMTRFADANNAALQAARWQDIIV